MFTFTAQSALQEACRFTVFSSRIIVLNSLAWVLRGILLPLPFFLPPPPPVISRFHSSPHTLLNSPLKKQENWAVLPFPQRLLGLLLGTGKNWPIADQRVSSNDPRNNCGMHFGSSSLLVSKMAFRLQFPSRF